MNKKVLWITQTAICIALLIAAQIVTSSFANTLITGSIVNLILIISVMICGFTSGITVAIVSPVFARLLGIGPLWTLIPFIMLGNISIVAIWHFITHRNGRRKMQYILAWLLGAVTKFLVLYIGIVKFAIPVLLQLPEKKATMVSAAFSLPQLVTALVGGTLALVILPIVKKAEVQ